MAFLVGWSFFGLFACGFWENCTFYLPTPHSPKNIVFPVEAEYSYFSVDFRLTIFL